ncbi:MAG: outer membrane lipoprotein-sorting protein [Verrucomicrobia bacterium]|nr:outer membrane lipoprotein-sorting protein [Verrucomicrobiota bacterium]
MTTRTRLIALLGAALCLTAEADEPDPTEIVRRGDDLLRGGASYARVSMDIKRPEWSRSLVMDAWTQGASNAFIRILSPPKEKGVTFLKKAREAWQYVPSVDRTIKIPPSMMLQSWMGSDFTNDDVVRADSLVVDYVHAISGEPVEKGVAYWVIEGTPKPGAPTVWGQIVFKIRKSNFVPDRVDFYDEDGTLIKYYESSVIREIEGREVATRFTMYDVTRPGYSTTLGYDRLTFKPEIAADTFTLRKLTR